MYMISVLYRDRLIRLSAGRQRLVRSGPARKEQIKSFVEDDEMKEKKRRISGVGERDCHMVRRTSCDDELSGSIRSRS